MADTYLSKVICLHGFERIREHTIQVEGQKSSFKQIIDYDFEKMEMIGEVTVALTPRGVENRYLKTLSRGTLQSLFHLDTYTIDYHVVRAYREDGCPWGVASAI